GAFICEVNGQPNLGQTTAAHLYIPLIRKLVSGSGRVPTVLVLGAANSKHWSDAILNAFVKRGLKVGVVSQEHVVIGQETVREGKISSYAGGQMLAMSREVDAMAFVINDEDLLRTGLPVARFDVLVFAGGSAQSGQEYPKWHAQGGVGDLLLSLLPACDGAVIKVPGSGLDEHAIDLHTTVDCLTLDGSVADIADKTVELAVVCAARRDSLLEDVEV
ncbi:MAG: hypothetical protein RL323_1512, partial [Pseudomonadota bacterium]